MNIKRILLSLMLFFVLSFVFPKVTNASTFSEALTSENSIITRMQEGFEYFFAFKVENKVQVLEKHAEKRLTMAQKYAEEGNNERVQNLVQSYLQIKEKQNNLLGQVDGQILGAVAENMIEQQKTMEEIKSKVDGNSQQNVIQVQEQVVNQVAKRVVDVNGAEDATVFLNEVVHVWAPGTEAGGGEAGVVYEGGEKLIYAPGTGPGGQAGVVVEGGELKFATGASMDSPGADIKTMEVKTGGGENNVIEEGSGNGLAPGTTQDGGNTNPVTNTIDPGGLAPGTTQDGETWLAP